MSYYVISARREKIQSEDTKREARIGWLPSEKAAEQWRVALNDAAIEAY